jgi:hypothetical protein
MKAMVCEMCNSNNIIKQDGVYVCQNCGSKYDPEEAKKLIVEISKPIVVDSNIETLIKSANGFLQLENWEDAMRLFEKVVEQDSTDYRGWWGKFLVKSRNFMLSPRRLQGDPGIYEEDKVCDASDAVNAIKVASEGVKKDLQGKWDKYVQSVPKTHLLTIIRDYKGMAKNMALTYLINGKPFANLRGGDEVTIEVFEGEYKIEMYNEIYSHSPLLDAANKLSPWNKAMIYIDTDSRLTIGQNFKGQTYHIDGGRIIR